MTMEFIGRAYSETGLSVLGDPATYYFRDNQSKTSAHIFESGLKSRRVRQNMIRELGSEYGSDSEQVLNAEMFAMLAPSIDAIAASQFKNPQHNKPWSFYNPGASMNLEKQIEFIMRSPRFKILTDSQTFKTLEILSILVDEASPKTLENLAIQSNMFLVEACKTAKPFICTYLADDFIFPAREPSEDHSMWMASLRLLLPTSLSIRSRIEEIAGKGWDEVTKSYGVSQAKIGFEQAFFVTALFAGTEHISPVIAQALEIPGYEMSVNELYKNRDYWVAMTKLTGIKFTNKMLDEVIRLMSLHEQGHIVVGQTGIEIPSLVFDEVLTDFQASANFLRDFTGDGYKRDIHDAIQVLITENVYQVLDANLDIPDGYVVAGNITLNALANSGILGVDLKRARLVISVSAKNIEQFCQMMDKYHNSVIEGEKAVLDEVEKSVLNPIASLVVKQFKDCLEGKL